MEYYPATEKKSCHCDKMDSPRKHYAKWNKWNKGDSKVNTAWCYYFYVESKKKIKNHKESKKNVAARGWKVGELERGWLKVQIFSYEINKVW